MRRLVIGITGGLASGKTTVSRYFRRLGAEVIDADEIAHLVLKEKNIKKKVISRFGKGLLKSGKIDRKKLARIVFDNKRSLKALCNIIYPPIIKEIKKAINKSKKNIIFVDAPVLIESGFYKETDKIIVVRVNKKKQISHCNKLGYSKKGAHRRIASQMPLRQKLRYADFIIDNNGSKKELKIKVMRVWRKLLKREG